MTFEERVARCLALGAHPELLDVFTIREIERLSFLRWCVQRGIVQEQLAAWSQDELSEEDDW